VLTQGNDFQKLEIVSILEGSLQEIVIFWAEIKNNYFLDDNQFAEKG